MSPRRERTVSALIGDLRDIDPSSCSRGFNGRVNDFLGFKSVRERWVYFRVLTYGSQESAHHSLAEEREDSGMVGVIEW